MPENTLRGQPFIGDVVNIYGGTSRTCSNCFYNNKEGEMGPTPTGRHCTTTSLAKKFELEKVPLILDGKEVGNYCPDFIIFSAD